MNLKNTAHNTKVIFLLALGIRSFAAMAGLHVSAHVDSDMRLSGDTDFHITASSADEAIAPGKTIDLADDNCRLFFNNILTSDRICFSSYRRSSPPTSYGISSAPSE